MAAKSSKTSSASKPINGSVDKDSTISVRQIQNGFLLSESGKTGKGGNTQYYTNEWFSKTNPIKIGSGNSNSGGMKFGKK